MDCYYLCLKLAEKHKLTASMLDVFFANGRLTEEQYTELIGKI